MAYYRPIQLQQVLSQPHPEIELHLDEFERRTRAFLDAVSSYTSRAIEEMQRRKDEHSQLLKREAEKRKATETEITDCKVKEIELMHGT